MNKWRHCGRKSKRWWANGCHLKSQEEKDARIKSRLNKRVNCEIVENTSNPCNSNPSSSSKVVWSMVGHLRRATIHRLVRLLEFKPVSRPVFTFGLPGVSLRMKSPCYSYIWILLFAISIFNLWYACHIYIHLVYVGLRIIAVYFFFCLKHVTLFAKNAHRVGEYSLSHSNLTRIHHTDHFPISRWPPLHLLSKQTPLPTPLPDENEAICAK